jgi:drug/metabolite transporter (DMT)-like permease
LARIDQSILKGQGVRSRSGGSPSFATVSALPAPRWSGYAKAFLATLLWGCSFIAIRFALVSATPYGLVCLRNALAVVLLFGILRLRGGPMLPEREDRGRVVLLGLLYGVHLLAQAYAVQFTSTMHAGWIVAFIPAVVAVGAWLFQRQRLRVVGWLGIVVATLGVLAVTSTRLAQFADAGLGDLILFGTTFTWAAYTLLTVGPARRSGGLRIAASAMAVSLLPALAMAAILGTWAAPPTAGSIVAIVFLGAGASALAMWTYSDAVAELGAERSAAFQYVQPLITMAAAALLLAEPLTSDLLIGGPVVLAGVWLVQRGKKGL